MQNHWLHPLNVLLVCVMATVMMMVSIETFFAAGNTWAGICGSSMYESNSKWNWAHILSATFWVIGFSAGVIGYLTSLSNALRLHSVKDKDAEFTRLKVLDKSEVDNLNLWLDTNTYGPEHLKELWQEDEK